jgi:hypothetical protein
MQIYKFCQCKNSTRKIYTNQEAESRDNWSFIVDCNQKRVFFPTDKFVNSTAADPEDYNNDNTQIKFNDYSDFGDVRSGSGGNNGKTKNKSIWSIFGITGGGGGGTSAASSNHKSNAASNTLLVVCMFFLNLYF